MDYLDQYNTTWLPIPNLKNYEVSSDGNVRNVTNGYCLTQSFGKTNGTSYYKNCHLGRIHRLLGSAMLGRKLDRLEYVCHLNGDCYDNRIDNLVISTAKRNALDKILHGTNGRKLSNTQVRTIRGLRKSKSAAALANQFGISVGHVYGILSGSRWGNLPC